MPSTSPSSRTSITDNNITYSPKGNPTSPHSTPPICVTHNQLIKNSGSYVLIQGQSEPDFILINNYIPDSTCQSIFDDIIESNTLKQHYNVSSGKLVKQPRLTSWFGPTSYSFSGCFMAANNPSSLPSVNTICKDIPKISAEISDHKAQPNSFLINHYRNGNDSVGIHKDDEPLMDTNEPICCLSLGQTRTLNLRSNKRGPVKSAIELKSGSLLIMPREFKNYFHNIPVDKSIHSRTSITFRKCNLTTSAPPANPISNLTPVPEPLTPSQTHTQPVSTFSDPTFKPSKHPQLIITKSSMSGTQTPTPDKSNIVNNKPSQPDFFPFCPQTILSTIPKLTNAELKAELLRWNLSNKGSNNILKDRLSDHVNNLIGHHSASQHPAIPPTKTTTPPPKTPDPPLNSESISNTIMTLERSILKLDKDIALHNHLLETLLIEKPDKGKHPIPYTILFLDKLHHYGYTARDCQDERHN